MDTSNLEVRRERKMSKKLRKKTLKEKSRALKKSLIDGTLDASLIFEESDELSSILDCQKDMGEFRKAFDEGFKNYLKGDWGEAKKKFDDSLGKRPDDGPSKTLRKVIEEHKFICPSWWKGYRSLDEKQKKRENIYVNKTCLLYTSPSPRDGLLSRMPSSA
eukprot:TRINITY_DN7426_c0_g1_i3.p2 TRINITY_DN7426_c0_g1~~TRINITY_DN7426_c0_g1_i3.p2  ORF type:complete len:161 (+),score=41.02 TRINITY_DN7426_c0_g1_i3:518-1000(+)